MKIVVLHNMNEVWDKLNYYTDNLLYVCLHKFRFLYNGLSSHSVLTGIPLCHIRNDGPTVSVTWVKKKNWQLWNLNESN
jgi:hypothetical protein